MKANPVDRILLENCGKAGALFVFPTDVALHRWADRLLRLRGGGTVAMEQFTAWDSFKQESIRSRMQDKKSIPSLLRKIFTSRLLEENAEAVKRGGLGAAIFRSLVPPEYSSSASSFAPWLSQVLPQLGSWFEKVSGKPAAALTEEDSGSPAFADGDDRDICVLAARYKKFLDENRLFEPAWEKPPFDDSGRDCFIFFPECLSDYCEYRGLLEKAERVTMVPLAESGAARPFKTYFHTNARSEITEAALYIRNLAEGEQVPWDSIVVCVPDTEDYEPYVLREFANRSIPAVRRAGKPLSSYPAGRLFPALLDCRRRSFSFEAVSNLLLNSHLPWKYRGIIDQLVDFGLRNNCLCSWVEGGKREDVWLDAFASPSGRREVLAANFYRELKTSVEKLCGASSFAEIRKFYFTFREQFLDIAECLPETDTILSRCISELLRLGEIEASFPGVSAPEPYRFFVEHLDETRYLPQEDSPGVSILPYRTAAPAPFDCHIVLGASQENLSEVFPRLAFLPRLKKEKLGLKDIDASKVFIDLHKLNSERPAVFFCSQESFSGFAIPHAALELSGKARIRYGDLEPGAFAPDLFDRERRFLSGPDSPAAPGGLLHEVQAEGFRAFMERRRAGPGGETGAGGETRRSGKEDDFTGGQLFADLARRRYGDLEPGAFAPDLFDRERRFLSGPDNPAAPGCILHEVQAEGFRAFMERRRAEPGGETRRSGREDGFTGGPLFADLARRRYGGKDFGGKLRVSATAMEPYFRCAAEWLYARILRLESVRMETSLMAENIMGSLYHALLNRFFDSVREKGGVLLPPDGEALPGLYRGFLASSAAEVFDSLPQLPGESRPLSALTVRFLRAGKQAAVKQTELLLAALLRYFGGFRVAGSETLYTAEGENHYLTGKVDLLLIDEREEEAGQAFIVDFKLNSLPRRADCIGRGERGLQNFQLPMYLSLAEANGCPPVHGALFFRILKAEPLVILGSIRDNLEGTEKPGRRSAMILRKQTPLREDGEGDEGEDRFAAILDEFRGKAGQYAEEAGTGIFSVFSTGEKQCYQCAYHRICRTLYTVEKERGLIRREKTDG
ncbi:MAG: PD-(D/E)XK nuclease family protein [Treponema sp.]|jgi:hypothetical protein|nr:PD-(D/E)XK nuclease family protein [Treponema sp.]